VFTFGANKSASPTALPAAPSAGFSFGTAPKNGQTAQFSFGAPSAGSAAASPPPPAFGFGQQTPAATNASSPSGGGFTFGQGASTFGSGSQFGQTQQPATFSFGSGQSQQPTATSPQATFSFGSPNPAQNQQATQGFNFGSPSQGFNFGAGAAPQFNAGGAGMYIVFQRSIKRSEVTFHVLLLQDSQAPSNRRICSTWERLPARIVRRPSVEDASRNADVFFCFVFRISSEAKVPSLCYYFLGFP
jgi:hypothetical protein